MSNAIGVKAGSARRQSVNRQPVEFPARHVVHPRGSTGLALSPAIVVAALSGLVLAGSFPGLGWWPLVFIGTALMLWSLIGRSLLGGFVVGLVGGFAFFGSLIFWSTVYLGPVPWLALTSLEAIFFAIGACLISIVWRWSTTIWPTTLGRIGLLPILIAGVWVAREAVSSVWPYGGFSWGRLAFSQSESPFTPLVAWVGVSGLSFLIAWVCALAVQLLREVTVAVTMRMAVVVAVITALVAIPSWPIVSSGSFRVAAVQGDSDAGLFAQYSPGQILQDHVSGTLPLIGEPVDLVIWPENAADLNPLKYPQSAAILDYISDQMDAPLITGTITENGDETFNSLLLWEPGVGAVAQYDKMHPVPFAEYLPDREFWYPLAPDLFGLIPRDYTIGTRPNVFNINGVTAGLAICFDIVDDDLIQKMLTNGADVILAPTNNADFGHTDESVQQLAIARLRAVETGRAVVNISTVGTSAMIRPDGSTIAQLPTFTPGSMLEDVPLSTTVTPAVFLNRTIEWFVSGLGLIGLVICLTWQRAQRRRRP